MRYWLSFRGPFGTRPGISVSGRELASWRRKPTAIKAEALLGVFRRSTDGELFLGIAGKNGSHEHEPGLTPVCVFSFATTDAAVAARDKALIRLSKHVGHDGLLVGISVGQVASAIRAEAGALGLEAQFVRVTTEAPEEAVTGEPSRAFDIFLMLLAAALVAMAVWHG